MPSESNERRRRRRVGYGPFWPWMNPRFPFPPEVIYPGYRPWDPFYPPMARRPEDEIEMLEQELEALEDEKVEVERAIEDIRKEIDRRKRDRQSQTDIR